MRTRLTNLWFDVRTSYWFLPLLMAVGAVLVSIITLAIDHRWELDAEGVLPVQFSGGPDAARAMLSTIAGTTITVGGVVFSILMVALSNASSQFGPRILRTFMGDLGTQVSLGTFIATFVYSLLVLQAVQDDSFGGAFIPFVSVSIALTLAMISIGVLIYFLHHSAGLINVTIVQARLGREMLSAISEHYPDELQPNTQTQHASESETVPLNRMGTAVLPDGHYGIVAAQHAGYVEAIDLETLGDVARANNLVIRVVRPPGDFAVPGADLAHVWPAGYADDVEGAINETFYLGPRRTTTQELAIFFDELTEIALRALSPAINDPYTAMTSIDWATAGLSMLARHEPPSRYIYDRNGHLRIIIDRVRFEAIIDVVFDQIRNVATDYPQVLQSMLQAIVSIAPCTRAPIQRAALRRQATEIDRVGRSAGFSWHETVRLRDAYHEAIELLNTTSFDREI